MSHHSPKDGMPGCGAMPLSRRDVLKYASSGFGLMALSALMADKAYADLATQKPHFTPKSEERHFLLHARRCLARRYLRPEAEACRTGRQTVRRLLPGRRQEGDQSQVGQESVAVQAAWAVRHLGQRTISHTSPVVWTISP